MADFKDRRSCVQTCQKMLEEIQGKKEMQGNYIQCCKKINLLLWINSPIRTETLVSPESQVNTS